jgi:hypothetical protein
MTASVVKHQGPESMGTFSTELRVMSRADTDGRGHRAGLSRRKTPLWAE